MTPVTTGKELTYRAILTPLAIFGDCALGSTQIRMTYLLHMVANYEYKRPNLSQCSIRNRQKNDTRTPVTKWTEIDTGSGNALNSF